MCIRDRDYVPQSNFRIRWQADQVDPRSGPNDPPLEFVIIDDDIYGEPSKYFEIDLSLNPTGNGRNGFFFPNAVGRVTIIDTYDPGKFIACYNMIIIQSHMHEIDTVGCRHIAMRHAQF